MTWMTALALLAVSAETQAHEHAQTEPAPPLSPQARTLLDAFHARIEGARRKYTALPPNAPVQESLRVRAALDETMRDAWPDGGLAKLSDDDQRALDNVVASEVHTIDVSNTAYLKRHLPADGWFRRSRDGEQAASDAWLIAQHSPDMRFQASVAARMAPLAATGEVKGSQFALIHDRTEMFAGRPQRYGSQVMCTDGRWKPAATEDLKQVDVRRRAMGMVPLAEYMKDFTGDC